LVVDGAGWHKAKKLVVPKGITLFFLPPYTPELNPVERLWQVSKRDCLRNRYYTCIGHIMDNLEAWFAAKSEPFYKGLCGCEFLS
ncbi:MAG: transposase, partial [Desulfovibrio sp.]|nr:transposase [Desulfovibrio sp.]